MTRRARDRGGTEAHRASAGHDGARRQRLRGDDGTAVVEFCVLAVVMLVPVVYLVLALGRIQAGAFAAQGAAREAGRAFVTADDEGSARLRADAAAAIAFADQGFDDPAVVGIDVRCAGSPCLASDQRVLIHSRVLVVLPGVPRLLDRVIPARIEVTARHVSTVDRFRGRGRGNGASSEAGERPAWAVGGGAGGFSGQKAGQQAADEVGDGVGEENRRELARSPGGEAGADHDGVPR